MAIIFDPILGKMREEGKEQYVSVPESGDLTVNMQPNVCYKVADNKLLKTLHLNLIAADLYTSCFNDYFIQFDTGSVIPVLSITPTDINVGDGTNVVELQPNTTYRLYVGDKLLIIKEWSKQNV